MRRVPDQAMLLEFLLQDLTELRRSGQVRQLLLPGGRESRDVLFWSR